MPFTYPVLLEVAGRRCVVVGGGPETVPKTVPLVEQGALVTVVTPAREAGLAELAAAHRDRVTVHHRPWREGDLAGALLCIAATGDHELNAKIQAEGAREGALVNAVDDPRHCDFAQPAVVRRGDLVVAVGTGGKAPALARRLRRELADRYGDEYGETAALIGEVRAETRPRWPSFAAWAERWQAALDDRVVELVRRGERDAARALLLARLAGPR
jgi:siroheme synthase-like protein